MNKKTMTEANIKQYLRLQEYLIRLHKTGKVCVFTELAGHVDWLDIHITPSHKDFTTRIYTAEPWLSNLSSKVVDGIINDIEKMLVNLEATKKQLAAEKEQQERETYLKLRKKYGD
jgi:hypothetical protein